MRVEPRATEYIVGDDGDLIGLLNDIVFPIIGIVSQTVKDVEISAIVGPIIIVLG